MTKPLQWLSGREAKLNSRKTISSLFPQIYSLKEVRTLHFNQRGYHHKGISVFIFTSVVKNSVNLVQRFHCLKQLSTHWGLFCVCYTQSVKIKNIIFDWDGTLSMTLHLWVAGYREALQNQGHTILDSIIARDFFYEHDKGQLNYPDINFETLVDTLVPMSFLTSMTYRSTKEPRKPSRHYMSKVSGSLLYLQVDGDY